MEEVKSKLRQLISSTQKHLEKSSDEELHFKPSRDKWSKKEILGHLVDSGINNLQRFTEIQFAPKPYYIRNYNQDELVKANHYQESELKEVLSFWMGINHRILKVIDFLSEDALRYEVIIEEEKSDLRFLIEDYVAHMEHHINQILR